MANYILPIARATLDSATLAGAYKAINSTGLANSCSVLRIINDSDTDINVSYDGTTDHDYVKTGETLQLDLQANSTPNSYVSYIRKGTVVYAKSAAGVGNIYVAGYYQAV